MTRSLKYLIIVASVTALMGCSALGGVGAFFGKKPSIEVNANIGKNVKQEKAQLKIETGKTEQTAETISNDTSYQAKTVNQITQDMPPWMFFVIIGLAGLAIDGKGFIYQVRSDVVGLLRFPFDFILDVMGRKRDKGVSGRKDKDA